MVTLTSIDYARLIQFTAAKMYHTLVNKTQVNKILFYIYGAFLAEGGAPLFTDDTPKAWTYGPVFPIPNKKIVPCEMIDIKYFPQEKIDAIKKDKKTLDMIVQVVGNMCNMTAYSLTQWSHQEGSPWYNTVYVKKDGVIVEQRPWNTKIEDDLIRQYFSNPQNRIFDERQ